MVRRKNQGNKRLETMKTKVSIQDPVERSIHNLEPFILRVSLNEDVMRQLWLEIDLKRKGWKIKMEWEKPSYDRIFAFTPP